MRLLILFLLVCVAWRSASAVEVTACAIEDLARLAPNFARKLYRPLFSTNADALKMMKINKTFPAANMFLMPPEKWLAPDAEFKEQMELRHRLFANRPHDILVIEPEQEARVQAASEELLAMVSKHVAEKFPETYEIADGRITVKPIGKSLSLTDNSDMHPMAKVALLVQDDITVSLRAPNNGPVTLYGGFVATPTHWSMQDFLNVPVHEIHAGVPGYKEKLERAVEGTISGHGGKVMGRNNWFIESNPELALPSYRTSTYPLPVTTPGNVAETLYLRSELESIFVLPGSKAAVFTIRPRVWSMPRVKEDAPEIAQQLSEALPTSQYAGYDWTLPLSRYLHTGVAMPPPERPVAARPAEGFTNPPSAVPPAPVAPAAVSPETAPPRPAPPPLIPEAEEPAAAEPEPPTR